MCYYVCLNFPFHLEAFSVSLNRLKPSKEQGSRENGVKITIADICCI